MVDQELKIQYYNSVYNTEANRLPGFLRTHRDHLRGHQEIISRYADVRHSLELVQGQGNPEVVALAEILGRDQREQLIGGLKDMGYQYAHYGQGAALRGLPGNHDEIVIATKDLALQAMELPALDLPSHQHGHGGGLVGVKLPDIQAEVFAGHLPLPSRRESYARHVEVLEQALHRQNQARRALLMGDFNLTPQELADQHPDLLKGMDRASPDVPTCTTVWPINWFYDKCLDHIHVRGFTPVRGEAMLWRSDHRAITAVIRVG